MANVQGVCKDEFLAVREAFEKNLDNGSDIGASAAVLVDGEVVVDLWGGYLDEERTRPWEKDTIINTFSTTKTMTALSALVLADRGEIDLDAPVAKYWPAFGAAGKGDVRVRQILGHTSGLPGWTRKMTLEDIYDLERSCALLAAQAPWWEPGTAAGYPTFCMGHLLSPIIERVTGRTLGRFFADEIAGPLGAEFHIGTGPEHDTKVTPLIPASPIPKPSGNDNFTDRSFFNPAGTPLDAFTIPWRRAEIGGANGHGNARGVAIAQSVLANGGAFGKRLLSESGRERVLDVQWDGMDSILGAPMKWGMGYALGSPVLQARVGHRLDGRRIAGWGGNGGSWAHVDLDARMSVSFVMNRWIDGFDIGRSFDVVLAAHQSLEAASEPVRR
jgi:CubicO group peptidase (beta-lactamase class C family)